MLLFGQISIYGMTDPQTLSISWADTLNSSPNITTFSNGDMYTALYNQNFLIDLSSGPLSTAQQMCLTQRVIQDGLNPAQINSVTPSVSDLNSQTSFDTGRLPYPLLLVQDAILQALPAGVSSSWNLEVAKIVAKNGVTPSQIIAASSYLTDFSQSLASDQATYISSVSLLFNAFTTQGFLATNSHFSDPTSILTSFIPLQNNIMEFMNIPPITLTTHTLSQRIQYIQMGLALNIRLSIYQTCGSYTKEAILNGLVTYPRITPALLESNTLSPLASAPFSGNTDPASRAFSVDLALMSASDANDLYTWNTNHSGIFSAANLTGVLTGLETWGSGSDGNLLDVLTQYNAVSSWSHLGTFLGLMSSPSDQRLALKWAQTSSNQTLFAAMNFDLGSGNSWTITLLPAFNLYKSLASTWTNLSVFLNNISASALTDQLTALSWATANSAVFDAAYAAGVTSSSSSWGALLPILTQYANVSSSININLLLETVTSAADKVLALSWTQTSINQPVFIFTSMTLLLTDSAPTTWGTGSDGNVLNLLVSYSSIMGTPAIDGLINDAVNGVDQRTILLYFTDSTYGTSRIGAYTAIEPAFPSRVWSDMTTLMASYLLTLTAINTNATVVDGNITFNMIPVPVNILTAQLVLQGITSGNITSSLLTNGLATNPSTISPSTLATAIGLLNALGNTNSSFRGTTILSTDLVNQLMLLEITPSQITSAIMTDALATAPSIYSAATLAASINMLLAIESATTVTNGNIGTISVANFINNLNVAPSKITSSVMTIALETTANSGSTLATAVEMIIALNTSSISFGDESIAISDLINALMTLGISPLQLNETILYTALNSAPGTYTAATLASQINTAIINEMTTFIEATVYVQDGGTIGITSITVSDLTTALIASNVTPAQLTSLIMNNTLGTSPSTAETFAQTLSMLLALNINGASTKFNSIVISAGTLATTLISANITPSQINTNIVANALLTTPSTYSVSTLATAIETIIALNTTDINFGVNSIAISDLATELINLNIMPTPSALTTALLTTPSTYTAKTLAQAIDMILAINLSSITFGGNTISINNLVTSLMTSGANPLSITSAIMTDALSTTPGTYTAATLTSAINTTIESAMITAFDLSSITFNGVSISPSDLATSLITQGISPSQITPAIMTDALSTTPLISSVASLTQAIMTMINVGTSTIIFGEQSISATDLVNHLMLLGISPSSSIISTALTTTASAYSASTLAAAIQMASYINSYTTFINGNLKFGYATISLSDLTTNFISLNINPVDLSSTVMHQALSRDLSNPCAQTLASTINDILLAPMTDAIRSNATVSNNTVSFNKTNIMVDNLATALIALGVLPSELSLGIMTIALESTPTILSAQTLATAIATTLAVNFIRGTIPINSIVTQIMTLNINPNQLTSSVISAALGTSPADATSLASDINNLITSNLTSALTGHMGSSSVQISDLISQLISLGITPAQITPALMTTALSSNPLDAPTLAANMMTALTLAMTTAINSTVTTNNELISFGGVSMTISSLVNQLIIAGIAPSQLTSAIMTDALATNSGKDSATTLATDIEMILAFNVSSITFNGHSISLSDLVTQSMILSITPAQMTSTLLPAALLTSPSSYTASTLATSMDMILSLTGAGFTPGIITLSDLTTALLNSTLNFEQITSSIMTTALATTPATASALVLALKSALSSALTTAINMSTITFNGTSIAVADLVTELMNLGTTPSQITSSIITEALASKPSTYTATTLGTAIMTTVAIQAGAKVTNGNILFSSKSIPISELVTALMNLNLNPLQITPDTVRTSLAVSCSSYSAENLAKAINTTIALNAATTVVNNTITFGGSLIPLSVLVGDLALTVTASQITSSIMTSALETTPSEYSAATLTSAILATLNTSMTSAITSNTTLTNGNISFGTASITVSNLVTQLLRIGMIPSQITSDVMSDALASKPSAYNASTLASMINLSAIIHSTGSVTNHALTFGGTSISVNTLIPLIIDTKITQSVITKALATRGTYYNATTLASAIRKVIMFGL